MAFMKKIRTKLVHWKLFLFGDKDLEAGRSKIIPCKNCGHEFETWAHYGELSYEYDSLCKECIK